MSTVANTTAISRVNDSVKPLLEKLQWLAPMALVFLALRVDVAWQFYKSGLTKIAGVDWYFIFPVFELSTTANMLFESEYNVPIFSPETAAMIAAYTELLLPLLLFAGLAGRAAALLLFGFNIVAVISYFHGLWFTGLIDHIVWALLFLAVIAYGPGQLSMDHLIKRWVNSRKHIS